MSKLTLTASEMQAAINELTSSNADFKARVADLSGAQENLSGMWQGDANTAFKQAFNSDKGQWDNFANLVDQYITALTNILNTYQNAESANTETARSRTY